MDDEDIKAELKARQTLKVQDTGDGPIPVHSFRVFEVPICVIIANDFTLGLVDPPVLLQLDLQSTFCDI